MINSRSLFLKKFFLAPAKIGSFTPSSQFLAKKMMERLPWKTLDTIVELGAGTGVFTEYIAAHKKPASRFLIIEQDARMRADLEERFPGMLFGGQAENLPYILKKYGLAKVDCIISGLPFAVFTPELRQRILTGSTAALQAGGRFIAFQYSLQMYFAFRRQFTRVRLGFELRNFPPAFVYYCQK